MSFGDERLDVEVDALGVVGADDTVSLLCDCAISRATLGVLIMVRDDFRAVRLVVGVMGVSGGEIVACFTEVCMCGSEKFDNGPSLAKQVETCKSVLLDALTVGLRSCWS